MSEPLEHMEMIETSFGAEDQSAVKTVVTEDTGETSVSTDGHVTHPNHGASNGTSPSAAVAAAVAMTGAAAPPSANKPATEQQKLVTPLTPDEERAEVVSRYTAGRKKFVNYEEDEIAFSILAKTDRYGFIHDAVLPRRPFNKDDLKSLERERERAMKWMKMLKSWSTLNPKKVKSRVFKGIPDSIRGPAWLKILGVESKKAQNQDRYEKCKQEAFKVSTYLRQIDLDVNRTWRDHVVFKERYSIKQIHLFNVLAAYTVYNEAVGYCQGMAGIVGLLLMYMDEEDAFWSLVVLFEDKLHNLNDLFLPGFPKLMEHFDLHEKLLNIYYPQLAEHFRTECVTISAYASKWFLQVFLDKIPFELTLRIWDAFILEGYRIAVVMALVFLKLHQEHLLKMDFEGILTFLQNLDKEEHSVDAVIKVLKQLLNDMSEKAIQAAKATPLTNGGLN